MFMSTGMSPAVWPEGVSQREEVIAKDGIELDFVRRHLLKGDRSLKLTPKECELLRLLMTGAGKPVPHRKLVNQVWRGPAARNIGHLRTLVRQLRKKIEDDPARPRYVQTVSEVGYVFGELLADANPASDLTLVNKEFHG